MFNKLSQCSIGRSCEYLGQSELGIWGFPGGNFRGNFELLAAICKQMRCQKCEIVCERASVVAAENRHLVLCQCRSITDYLGRLCKYKGGEGFEQLNGKRERARVRQLFLRRLGSCSICALRRQPWRFSSLTARVASALVGAREVWSIHCVA